MKKSVYLSILPILFIINSGVLSIAGVKQYFSIDPEKCDGCAICVGECPEEAITQSEINGKIVFIIDPVKCNADSVCVVVCPLEAIYPDSSDLSLEIKSEKKEDGEEAKPKEAKKNEPAKKKKKKVTKYIVK